MTTNTDPLKMAIEAAIYRVTNFTDLRNGEVSLRDELLKALTVSSEATAVTAQAPDAQAVLDGREDEYMCENCVTPWKCNGPHIPATQPQSDAQAIRNAALDAAEEACNNDRLVDNTGIPADDAYNMAIGHCTEAIRALRSETGKQAEKPEGEATTVLQLKRMIDEWEHCEKIANIQSVDDALRGFSEDPTGDNGIYVVREILRHAKADQPQADEPTTPYTAMGGDDYVHIKRSLVEWAQQNVDCVEQEEERQRVSEELGKVLTAPAVTQEPVVPEGYALIGIELLRHWGKYDEVRAACCYPRAAAITKGESK